MKYSNWYAVQVAAGCEMKAMSDLIGRKGVMGDTFIQDVEVPQKADIEISQSGKKKTVKTKILPGYILVQVKKEVLEPEEGCDAVSVFPAISHDTIRSTSHVIGFAGPDKKKPREMSASEVKRIFALANVTHEEVKSNILAQYKVGDTLSVISGPFEGKEIQVSNIKGNKVMADIDIFGRITAIEFSKDQLLKK